VPSIHSKVWATKKFNFEQFEIPVGRWNATEMRKMAQECQFEDMFALEASEFGWPGGHVGNEVPAGSSSGNHKSALFHEKELWKWFCRN
jgi:hypothetical protein